MRSQTAICTTALLLLSVAACERDVPPTGPDESLSPAVQYQTAADQVPERDDPWRAMSTEDLWAHIVRYDTSVTLAAVAGMGSASVV